ncbi:Acyl-protein thioesterase 1 [Gracilariopsis chorda]|uniref:palmitoyl-protein hydrolase n=1 Tax=Gracilariopsis chorda TaxID=448386 RepID=A0A2V3IW63_9FLOR|nr:Acyl-protein thioesterase 1 [Gracilariopsis chorda]|eukprot:PXF46386.1 Acyl-protein thioesterase 1 [Gracilariopsis chorda]
MVSMFGGGDGVEVPSRGKATAAIIFLHGLGDTAYGWAPAFPLPNLDHVKTILPTAPTQAVTLNAGFRMPSWFDLRGLDENAADDEQGILQALSRVNRAIDYQVEQGIPAERIVVGGFSQGGAVAITAALRLERKVAGFVSLSGWLPLRHQYPTQMTTANQETALFMGHGTTDPVVSHRFGKSSAEFVKHLGRKASFSSYAGLTHSASQQELDDVKDFIASVVPP